MTFDINQKKREETILASRACPSARSARQTSERSICGAGAPPRKKNVLLNVLAILRYGPQEAAQLTVRVQQATEMLTAQRDAKQGARKNS